MRGDRTELYVRSGREAVAPGEDRLILAPDAAEAADRILSLWSEDGRPWRARISWGAGQSAPTPLEVSVPGTTRVGIFGKGLSVRAINDAAVGTGNRVCCVAVADGFLHQQNVLEQAGVGTGVPADVGALPAWSECVRLEVDDGAALPASELRLYSAAGDVVSRIRGDRQPEPWGIQIGATSRIDVLVPLGNRFRLLFRLRY